PSLLLIDAVSLSDITLTQKAIIKGDSLSASIAAASIIAKVTRDRLMEEYDRAYPLYRFAKHKGYPTKEHIALLKSNGPCPIHRLTFSPVSQLVNKS
ncbi:MAG: ribonuclease HII, partial [Spirochaetota bacterium]|nr:ribonuclease HII [Spirochaetota bacterium]